MKKYIWFIVFVIFGITACNTNEIFEQELYKKVVAFICSDNYNVLEDQQELTGDEVPNAGDCCGWWIEIGAEPLANALAEAMTMSEEGRVVLGENGRKLVAAKYTWQAVGKKLAGGYQEVLDKG